MTLIGIAGSGQLDPSDPRWTLAEQIGRGLVDAGFRIATGGLGGVMAAAARGARSSPRATGADVIGLLPGLVGNAANPWVDIPVPTGLGHARNLLIARCDALVAIGGGAGTLSEVAMAWVHDRHIIAMRVDGWSGRLADTRLDERRRFDDQASDVVHGADTAEEVVALLQRLLPR